MKKLTIQILLIVLSFTSLAISFAASTTDDDIKAKLVAGSWHDKEEFPELVSERITIFYPDNTLWTRGAIYKGNEVMEVEYRAKYTIENGFITETVVSSNRPDAIPIGKTTTDKVLEITDSDFIYEYKGESHHLKRTE